MNNDGIVFPGDDGAKVHGVVLLADIVITLWGVASMMMLPTYATLCQKETQNAGTRRIAAVLVVVDGSVIGQTKVKAIAIGLAILASPLHVEAELV